MFLLGTTGIPSSHKIHSFTLPFQSLYLHRSNRVPRHLYAALFPVTAPRSPPSGDLHPSSPSPSGAAPSSLPRRSSRLAAAESRRRIAAEAKQASIDVALSSPPTSPAAPLRTVASLRRPRRCIAAPSRRHAAAAPPTRQPYVAARPDVDINNNFRLVSTSVPSSSCTGATASFGCAAAPLAPRRPVSAAQPDCRGAPALSTYHGAAASFDSINNFHSSSALTSHASCATTIAPLPPVSTLLPPRRTNAATLSGCHGAAAPDDDAAYQYFRFVLVDFSSQGVVLRRQLPSTTPSISPDRAVRRRPAVSSADPLQGGSQPPPSIPSGPAFPDADVRRSLPPGIPSSLLPQASPVDPRAAPTNMPFPNSAPSSGPFLATLSRPRPSDVESVPTPGRVPVSPSDSYPPNRQEDRHLFSPTPVAPIHHGDAAPPSGTLVQHDDAPPPPH